ncbi:hypothetical protein K438DRAFT_2084843 [Mycena galopus ATCC 62051]|nr:hypothetical protein K438DRAFT_2084843 [Mycena galopus ATCC 62051]
MGKLAGRCTITNVSFCNHASLPTDDDGEDVVGSIPSGTVPDAAKWDLIDLTNDRYSIQNVNYGYFLRAEIRPQEHANVKGVRAIYGPYPWKIVESETAGQYLICAEDSTLYWGLGDASDRTPVSFTILSFTVKADWDGLPSGFTIRFLESISIIYQRRVVAAARPNQDFIATGSKTLFATVSVLDTTAFGEFVSSVVSDSAVQVTLSLGRFSFYNATGTQLPFAGFDSFKGLVNMSNVRIAGSDPQGVYTDATITASIKNPTDIDITASFTVSVYFGQTKELRLRPRLTNDHVLNWKFQPPPPFANNDVRTFINQYITTSDEIPLEFRVENQSIMICNHKYALPLFVVQSSIKGLGSRFIRKAYVYVGLGAVLSKRISFAFHFVNPLDATLTIRDIELDAHVLGTRLLEANHTFRDFTISPRSDKKSPKVKHAHLIPGRIGSLRALMPGVTVNVRVKSATVW